MEKLPTAEALGRFALLHESLPICENPVLHFAGPVYRLLFLRASSNDVRKHFINHPPHRRGRTMVWSEHGGIRVKISSTAERSS